MTLEQWRRSEQLTAWASQVFNSENGRILLDILAQMHPKELRITDPEQMHLTLGMIYGHDSAMSIVKAACQFMPPSKPIEESWGTQLPLNLNKQQ